MELVDLKHKMWLYLRQWCSGYTDFLVAASEMMWQGGACKKSFQMFQLNFWHANGNADYSLLILDAVMSVIHLLSVTSQPPLGHFLNC